MPPATGNSAVPVKPAPRLPALPIGREELTLILNKSAANAVENATRMSVPQSEKAALREMARELPLENIIVSYGMDMKQMIEQSFIEPVLKILKKKL